MGCSTWTMYDLHVRRTMKDEDPVPLWGELHEPPSHLSVQVDHWWWDHPAMYSTQHLFLHDGAARGGLRVSLEGLLRRDLGAASPGGCELWSYGVTKDWRRCCAFFVILNLRFLDQPTLMWTWHELAVYFQFMNRVRAFHQTSITIIMSYMAIGFLRKTTSRLHWIQSWYPACQTHGSWQPP